MEVEGRSITVYRCRTLAEALNEALSRPLPPPKKKQERRSRWADEEEEEDWDPR